LTNVAQKVHEPHCGQVIAHPLGVGKDDLRYPARLCGGEDARRCANNAERIDEHEVGEIAARPIDREAALETRHRDDAASG